MAQKKYHLFGKNKCADMKNSSQTQNYYIDYSQQLNYVYANNCQVASTDNYNQINYYTAINHNHTYAQPVDVSPLSSMSSNVPSWSSRERLSDPNESSKKSETTRNSNKTSNQQKEQDNLENIQKEPHLNRDEKRARSLKIPISTHDIINLPIDEFNERLTKYELTEIQLSLIRDIRRRG